MVGTFVDRCLFLVVAVDNTLFDDLAFTMSIAIRNLVQYQCARFEILKNE